MQTKTRCADNNVPLRLLVHPLAICNMFPQLRHLNPTKQKNTHIALIVKCLHVNWIFRQLYVSKLLYKSRSKLPRNFTLTYLEFFFQLWITTRQTNAKYKTRTNYNHSTTTIESAPTVAAVGWWVGWRVARESFSN